MILSSFVMIYLTDTVGLSSGIVGTLMMVSKLFDGITDIFFGSMIDKTKSKFGKARPWMLWAYFGCSAMIMAIFAIPFHWTVGAKYAWFFIAYTALNAVLYLLVDSHVSQSGNYNPIVQIEHREGKCKTITGSIRYKPSPDLSFVRTGALLLPNFIYGFHYFCVF